MQKRSLRVAVIGVGHMGRHHARLYHDLPESDLIAVVDLDGDRAREHAKKYGAKALTDAADLLDLNLDAATVAVPTVAHERVAGPLIEAGVALLVEKPLAPDTASARRLLEKATAHDAILQVGHSERFNPVVRALDRMGLAPRFIETHRISPFTFRSADIGVVFDMMIHDIDILLHLVRCSDYEVRAVGVNVLSQHEDVANARVEFANGCVANLTASRLALKTERKIRVFCPDAYLSLDYQKKIGIAIKLDANLDLLKLARERDLTDLSQVAGLDFGKMVNVEALQIDDVEPLRAELQAFLEAARTKTTPPVSAEEGLAAVELAERITQAVRDHVWDRGG
ncbi:MAG: Gfo/Idh/MocA family oxidoreductase [Planctomycetes bacterium]|nr:Gfo/Idh/MocA family oxidoreductase [Planctomycetota bacterium]